LRVASFTHPSRSVFNAPYDTALFAQYAEPIPGPTSDALSVAAARAGVTLFGGSIIERAAHGKLYNTALAFDPSGALVAKHRKMHLFDVDIEGGITFTESAVLARGNAVTWARIDALGAVSAGY
jgi:predicted amidohydrolase